MKKKTWLISFLFFVMVITSACAQKDQYSFKTKPNVRTTAINSTLKNAMNTFGLNVFKTEVNFNKNTNIMISPLSIFTALNISTMGAGGNTRTQMKKIMGVEKLTENVRNDSMNTLINYIRNTAGKNEQSGTQIYNSLWVNKGANLTKLL